MTKDYAATAALGRSGTTDERNARVKLEKEYKDLPLLGSIKELDALHTDLHKRYEKDPINFSQTYEEKLRLAVLKSHIRMILELWDLPAKDNERRIEKLEGRLNNHRHELKHFSAKPEY